jgi:hypothetical protein
MGAKMLVLLAFIAGALLWHLATRSKRRAVSLGLHITTVRGRRSRGMIIEEMPGIEVIDTQYVVASLAPKDEDGRIIPKTEGHVYTWAVTEQVPAEGQEGDVATLVVSDDMLSAEIHSGCPGTAIVTALNDDPNPDDQILSKLPVTNKFGKAKSNNMSVGAPMPEQP